MQLGVLSLADIQADAHGGSAPTASQRLDDIIAYGILADRLGLDVFGLGEHHTPAFAVSSPAVVLAAMAQDFAALDLISHGRAEIAAGRSAFTEPFALFGEDTANYDALFAEKLDLLLRLRASDHVTWSGRFRPALRDAAIAPRAFVPELPVWVGVGGTPASPERIRVGITSHFYIAEDERAARQTIFPYYRQYLAPKTPGSRGFVVDRASLDALAARGGALMIGSPEQIIEKILDLHAVLGADRFLGQIDFGGLPRHRKEPKAILVNVGLLVLLVFVAYGRIFVAPF